MMTKEQLQNIAASEIEKIRTNQVVYFDNIISFCRAYGNEEDENDAIILGLDLEIGSNYEELVEKVTLLLNRVTANFEENHIIHNSTELIQPESNKKIITAKGVSVKYKSSNFTLVIDSLDIEIGKIYSIIGRNSSGKSTLYKLLSGEIAPTSGKINFESLGSNWSEVKRNISYVPQEIPKWYISLIDTLHYEAARNGIVGSENIKEVKFIIHRLGLYEHQNKQWEELSGGIKLRFALAKALVKGAKLLLLDEPLANLDIIAQQAILADLLNLVQSINRPMSVLLSSQHIHEIEGISDEVFFMDNGILEHLGNPNEYRSQIEDNTFSLQTEATFSMLNNIAAEVGIKRIKKSTNEYIITTKWDINIEDIILHFKAHDIYVKYIRDISNSVKMRFYE